MTVADLTLALRASRQRLLAAIQGLTEEQFRFVPPDGGWSVAAHLAHLLRTERAYVEAARAALTEHMPFAASTGVHNDDDPGLARRLAVPQIIHGLQACRRELELAIEGGGEQGLTRTFRHERMGPMTIADVAKKMASHEEEHAAAIEPLARSAARARGSVIPLTPRRG